MEKHKEKIKRRILIPLTLAILLLLMASIVSINWFQEDYLHSSVLHRLGEVKNSFEDELRENAELLSALINFIEKDTNLQNAWLEKDRDALLAYAKTIFDETNSKFRITHFCFHDIDRICFLRVHKPERYGDYIRRYTMAGAVRDEKQTWGIELGSLGTFTLRVVQPWWINSKLAGYIELGEEIEYVTPQLKEVTNADMAFFIRKSLLNRTDWEQGMKMLGNTANWDQFPKHVLIDNTLNNLPDVIGQMMESHHLGHNKFLFEMSTEKRKYHCGFVPLIDAGENEVGDIVVMCDVTEQQAELQLLLSTLISICVIIGALLFWLFYFYINSIERKIIDASDKQQAEIQQRKLTEKALQKARDYLSTVIAAIPESFMVIDPQFRIVLANKAACDLSGVVDPVAKGMKCHQISHYCDTPCEEPLEICPLRQVLDTKKEAKVMHTHYTLDGKPRYVEVIASPIFGDNGEITQIIEACHDITVRRLAEEKQSELFEKIRSINEELKSFAHTVSHDLKAPLRGVSAIANWLAVDYADKFDEHGREQLMLLSLRVQRMHNLIEGVLQYSRAGSQEEERVSINLEELLPEIIDAIAPPDNIEVIVDQLPVITCCKTRITQVFQNLLSNAVKYMDKPQGRIKVACIEENDFWKFSVTDNGPGIEEKDYEKVFKMFQVLAPKDEFESTGVGLTVVKKIIEMYDGRIWVESTPGDGSIFYFTLPKQESEVLENAQL